jgi:hypothetical protein
MILDADGSHVDDGLGVILDVVVDAQIADTQLPGREGIRSRDLPISSLRGRLMSQLLVDGIEHDHPIARGQCTEVVFALGRIHNPVGHERSLLPDWGLVGRPILR